MHPGAVTARRIGVTLQPTRLDQLGAGCLRLWND